MKKLSYKQSKKKGLPHAKHNDWNRPYYPKDHKKEDRKKHIIAEGTYCGTQYGYGFVSIEGQEEDIFIPEGKNLGALDKDIVVIRYHKYFSYDHGTEKTEGEVLEIKEEVHQSVVGTVLPSDRLAQRARTTFYPISLSDKHLNIPLYVADLGKAEVGDKVEVLLPPRRANAYRVIGDIIRTFGNATTREANYNAILSECGVVEEFSEKELQEAEEVSKIPLTLENRKDRRKDLILTIDGPYAKDLDDAISLKRLDNGNVELGVHIADVSTYVKPGTALDHCAMTRGTSIYFTDKVVPMLPTTLSNGSCSLNAGEDKYALSCLMEMKLDGSFVKTKIERSLIRSSVRGVYFEVNDLFEKKEKSEFFEKYKIVYEMLEDMHKLYIILSEKSTKRGALELESTDAYIQLDEAGIPIAILPEIRGDAEKMIEQFMLAANECVATKLNQESIPCIYRIHEDPPKEKQDDLKTYVQHLGLSTRAFSKDKMLPSDYADLLKEAKEAGIGAAFSYTLLRSMSKAKYSEVCKPHFGLNIEKYCHFTSPIRRLSDLATHRIIEAVLLDGAPKLNYEKFAKKAADAATETELTALTAERKIDALYKAIYLSYHLGEEFEATVSSCTSFGLFAELDNTCEGLIPMSEMPGYWRYDDKKLSIRSSRGDSLTLGDRIRIRVEDANLQDGRVRFSLLGYDPLSYLNS